MPTRTSPTPAVTDSPPPTSTPAPTPVPPTPTEFSWRHAISVYRATAQANVVSVGERLAVLPSPAYPRRIWGRDAFYTALGLENLELTEQTYRWFETAQDPETGQIETAVPLVPNDRSLLPQDDETTLLFLIWSGVLQRSIGSCSRGAKAQSTLAARTTPGTS